MSLIVLIGAQAVGKMTVGRALEKKIDGKLLFNHQTIDLFATFLGYHERTFELSHLVRKELFNAFVTNTEKNTTKTIIFTLLVDFDSPADIAFLKDISDIFLDQGQSVYFIELIADLKTRLDRNKQEDRLQAKPSKRDLIFSEAELLGSHHNKRLISNESELKEHFPEVNCYCFDNTTMSPDSAANMIAEKLKQDE